MQSEERGAETNGYTSLSERSDRYRETRHSEVMARHQEEFCQAVGWLVGSKYDGGSKREPRWEQAYQLLARYAAGSGDGAGTVDEGCWQRAGSSATWTCTGANLGFSHTLTPT